MNECDHKVHLNHVHFVLTVAHLLSLLRLIQSIIANIYLTSQSNQILLK